jgi:hypothetical protein
MLQLGNIPIRPTGAMVKGLARHAALDTRTLERRRDVCPVMND